MIYLKRSLILLFLPFATGCAVVAIGGAGLGVHYTLSNMAYKTFDSSLDQVSKATSLALKKLDIKVVDNSKTDEGRKIKGATKDLDIQINLETITSNATKVKVNAKKGMVRKDKATATEIIDQIDRILDGKA